MRHPLNRYRDLVFFASGFAGLIYESIWTHYLKLFLGHAAYAQTLVLAIFMGGMAVGAGLTARSGLRLSAPLRTYALVEAAIGLCALAFHPLFVAATGGFHELAFSQHIDGMPFVAAKWGLAILLILPQSILLGATFPLYASAAARHAPATEGRSIATLYAANSLGGALGVLLAGFVLIPAAGLFGAIAAAGTVNLAIAAIVLWRCNAATPQAAPAPMPVPTAPAPPAPAARPASKRDAARRAATAAAAAASAAPAKAAERSLPAATMTKLLLAVSFLTGASSFIYEIGWIRMLSLVLGGATHSFELMLSAFVLGLALGGLWVRRRIDTAAHPGILLGRVQIAMGAAALATVPLHSLSFDLVAWAMGVLPRTDGGYALFNLLRYGVASLVMFPATFCAGMTLPLATRVLFSVAGEGERAIGRIYSANTLGAIAGLLFAVHIGLPWLGLEYLIGAGALVDVALGAVLLVAFGGTRRVKYAIAALVACVAGTAAVAATFDPQKITSGVFRTGKAVAAGKVLELAHGKTATISVERKGDFVMIKTNGKPDASAILNDYGYAPDQVTMTLLGAIPLLLHAAPARVANIGFGSAITGEALLADPRVRHLDTIEIEPQVVALARHFGDLNRSVYADPRSAVHIDDAKSFFAAGGKTYDLVISEPSNPWISGVAGLFSVEFYRQVGRYLNEDGLFAQWLQTYETHPDRFISVLKAMDQAFDDYLVVALDDGDTLLVGKPHGRIAIPGDGFAGMPPRLLRQLLRVEVANQADITFRIVGNKALFGPWLGASTVAANSDYHPYLDSNADRDRFFDQFWPGIVDVVLSPFPIAEVIGGRPPLPTPSNLSVTRQFGTEPAMLAARLVKDALFGIATGPLVLPMPSQIPEAQLDQGARILDGCDNPPPGDSPYAAARLATRVLPFLSPAEGRNVLNALRGAACLNNLYGAQVAWPVLLGHAADRNPKGFGPVADAMLVSGQGGTEIRARYLLGMAMLGQVAAGAPDRARALWDKFSPKALGGTPPGLPFELLRAHAFAAVPR